MNEIELFRGILRIEGAVRIQADIVEDDKTPTLFFERVIQPGQIEAFFK